MKTTKFVFSIFLLSTVLFVTSCSKDDSEIITGTWNYSDVEIPDASLSNEELTILKFLLSSSNIKISFNANGTCSIYAAGDTSANNATYQLEDGKIVLTSEGVTQSIPYSLKKNKLTLRIPADLGAEFTGYPLAMNLIFTK